MHPLSLSLYLVVVYGLYWTTGHSNQIRAVNKRITAVRTKVFDRIDKLDLRINVIERSVRQIQENEHSTVSLSQAIRSEFELNFKREILEAFEGEINNKIVGKLVREIIDGGLYNNQDSKYDETIKELENLRQGLQIQKTNIKAMDSEIKNVLTKLKLHKRHEKKIREAEVCWDMDKIPKCIENHSNKTLDDTKNLPKPTESTDGPLNTPERHVTTMERSSLTVPPRRPTAHQLRKVIVADLVHATTPFSVIYVPNSKLRKLKLQSSRVSSIAFHPTKERMFFAVGVPGSSLRSARLDGSLQIIHDVGTDIVTKIALDFPQDVIFYTTNFPYSITTFSLRSSSYNSIKSFPSSEKPTDISIDIITQSVFVVISFHTGKTAIRCIDYFGRQRDIPNLPSNPQDRPISAVGFGETLWFNMGRELMSYSYRDRSERPKVVTTLPDEPDDFEIWFDKCYVAYKKNSGIDSVSAADGILERLMTVNGKNRHQRSISLIG